MTIETITEISGDQSSLDRSAGREASRRFLVKTRHTLAPIANSERLLQLVFRARIDLKPWAAHPFRRRLYVTEPSATRRSRWLWELTVPYSTEIALDELERHERGDNNPLNDPAKVTITTTSRQVIVTEDVHGDPLINRAGDRFSDIEDDDYPLEVNVRKNVSQVKDEWLNYRGAINEDAVKFLGIEFFPLTLRVTSLQVGERDIGIEGTKFYPLSMKFSYLEEGWIESRLNEGLREKRLVVQTNPDGNLVRAHRLDAIRNEQGEPIDEPVFLDKKGRAYRVGVDPKKDTFTQTDLRQPLRTELSKDEIVKLAFDLKTRPRKAFSKLPIK
jgi:hypothetical protein